MIPRSSNKGIDVANPSNDSGTTGTVAVVLAALSVVSAVVVLFNFGLVEVGYDRIVNWPIIIGCAVGAAWACVAAAVVLDVRHNRNTLAVLLAAQVKKDEAEAAKKAEQDAMAAAMAAIEAESR